MEIVSIRIDFFPSGL